MWKEIGLIGRDNLLKTKIRPRLRSHIGFVMLGQHGIGKTAVLEWCFDQAEGKKSIISATSTFKEILSKICQDWELEVTNEDGDVLPKSKWLVPLMYRAVLAESGHWLMIDDIQRITPTILQKIKPIRDRHSLICAGIPPLRKEELKRLLWGIKNISIKPIRNSDMMRMGQKAAPLLKTSTPVHEAVHAARGIPAHLFHALRGEVTPEAAKTKDEEIDLSPVLMVVLAGIMAMRYVARGIESQSMYILSGLGMAGAVIFRFYLYRGMRR